MKTFFSSCSMRCGAVLSLLSTLAVGPVPSLRAQQAVATAPAVQESGEGGSRRGITVHGHWTIDVKDKDGKLVEHRDFYNSLVPAGSTGLALALTGQLVYSSAFAVAVKDSNSAQLYQLYSSAYPVTPCTADGQSTVDGNIVRCVSGLTETYPSCIFSTSSPCTTSSGIVLQGSFTASAPLTVDTVQTYNNTCTYSTLLDPQASVPQSPVAIDPQSCGSATATVPAGVVRTRLGFTATTVTPLSVAAGQSLLVKVILSFS